MDDPATDAGTGVYTVQTDDGIIAEESVEYKADDSGDAVLGENVHGVIDADPVFDYWQAVVSEMIYK